MLRLKPSIDPRLPSQVGRADLKRSAFAQGRQAFRRARVAVPQKLLLNSSQARPPTQRETWGAAGGEFAAENL